MSKAVITITDAEFETEVLKAEQPVLVYFWADWCGPCQLMSPAIASAAIEYSDRLKVVKMEIDPNPLTVKQYQVEGVPALRLFLGQEVLISTEGVIGKDKLLALLDTHLNSN
ncbi:MAG: thioredoxin family protein [Nostoc sp.]|uniref:thioredoxin family protein n=1 Tax=unclassified Nostoc TaxID=2593658 RepID=UPI0025E356FA|nr:thioredoxin family protein [Nostoc sp. NMS7]MBN3949864.1 thioredoxin [Nostoc sp. NMS7]